MNTSDFLLGVIAGSVLAAFGLPAFLWLMMRVYHEFQGGREPSAAASEAYPSRNRAKVLAQSAANVQNARNKAETPETDRTDFWDDRERLKAAKANIEAGAFHTTTEPALSTLTDMEAWREIDARLLEMQSTDEDSPKYA